MIYIVFSMDYAYRFENVNWIQQYGHSTYFCCAQRICEQNACYFVSCCMWALFTNATWWDGSDGKLTEWRIVVLRIKFSHTAVAAIGQVAGLNVGIEPGPLVVKYFVRCCHFNFIISIPCTFDVGPIWIVPSAKILRPDCAFDFANDTFASGRISDFYEVLLSEMLV